MAKFGLKLRKKDSQASETEVTAPPPPSFSSFFTKPRLVSKGLTAIGISSDGVSLVHIVPGKEKPYMDICDYKVYTGADDLRALLSGLIQENKLKKIPCSTVLEPGTYSLHMVDAPNVEPEEMKAAIRWRIKELIDYEIEDAVYDIFGIPGRSMRGQGGNMLYAVVARSYEIEKRVNQLRNTGVKLSVIDIPEIAMRNIAALLPEDEQGIAMLHLARNSGMITVTRGATLYLARNIGIGINQLRHYKEKGEKEAQQDDEMTAVTQFDNALENIMLEVQRSLDYYERHSSNPPINTLVITPLQQELPGFIEYFMEKNLGLQVNVLDLNSMIESTVPMTNILQTRCFFTIGAALRNG